MIARVTGAHFMSPNEIAAFRFKISKEYNCEYKFLHGLYRLLQRRAFCPGDKDAVPSALRNSQRNKG